MFGKYFNKSIRSLKCSFHFRNIKHGILLNLIILCFQIRLYVFAYAFVLAQKERVARNFIYSSMNKSK